MCVLKPFLTFSFYITPNEKIDDPLLITYSSQAIPTKKAVGNEKHVVYMCLKKSYKKEQFQYLF